MAIDDPIEALEKQIHADRLNPVTDGLLRALAVLAKRASGYAFLADAVQASLGKEASDARLRDLLEILVSEVRRHGTLIESLTDRLRSVPFIESLVVAADYAQRCVNMKKIKRFALVLGRELVSEGPTWDEAQAFIRNISELDEKDIKTLDLVRPDFEGPYEPGFFGSDEFQSCCGRLYGFGLVSEVIRGPSVWSDFRGPRYTISSRGLRLLHLIRETGEPEESTSTSGRIK
jgi:hypothetical protein